MSYDGDLYSHPEAAGLRIFCELSDPEASYSFGLFVVWEQIDGGALFFGSDSGCSCPSPFEGVNAVSDLTPIEDTSDSWTLFRACLDDWRRAYSNSKKTTAELLADCGALEGMVSMHLAKASAARRVEADYISAAAYRDAVAKAEAAEKRAEAQAKLYQDCYTKLRASELAHRRLSTMLNGLGREIELYMGTEAPQAKDVTYKVQTARTADTGKAAE